MRQSMCELVQGSLYRTVDAVVGVNVDTLLPGVGVEQSVAKS